MYIIYIYILKTAYICKRQISKRILCLDFKILYYTGVCTFFLNVENNITNVTVFLYFVVIFLLLLCKIYLYECSIKSICNIANEKNARLLSLYPIPYL